MAVFRSPNPYASSQYGYQYSEEDKYLKQMKTVLGTNQVNTYRNKNEVYGGKGSDLLGRDRDLEYSGKHLDQSFKKMADLGLTPQEMIGSPAAGGAGRSGGNATLGQSGAAAHSAMVQAETANRQMATQANTAIKVAQINAKAMLGAERIRSGVATRGQDVVAKTQRSHQDVQKRGQDIQRVNFLDELKRKKVVDQKTIEKIEADVTAVMNDTWMKQVVHGERWQKLFATMSSENVVASAAAALSGVDIEQLLRSAPETDRKSLQKFINSVLAMKSTVNIETEAIASIIVDAFKVMFGVD
jgi:hypothetical protein